MPRGKGTRRETGRGDFLSHTPLDAWSVYRWAIILYKNATTVSSRKVTADSWRPEKLLGGGAKGGCAPQPTCLSPFSLSQPSRSPSPQPRAVRKERRTRGGRCQPQ